ncbi:MAG TPA: FtsX-like permease family protein, partial [Bryobacteraceae bacterium]|nr:FtsX-like permease family protein [Bryobacteraceae bacterium]
AIAGGASGALAGNWVCHTLNNLRPLGDFPIRLAFVFDWRVFTYVAAVALSAGILAGLAPALRVSRANLNETLREGGRGMIGGGRRHTLRNGLVVAQVAGSLIVLVAAGLFTRSLSRAQSIDLGFDPHHVLNVGIDPGIQGYDQPKAEAFFRELLRRSRALPGVEVATVAYSVPMSYYSDGGPVYVEGQALPPNTRVPGAGYNIVSPDYFAVMRMRILAGRVFTDADTATSPPVAIVSQAMARRLWPNQDPVGRRFSYHDASGPWVTVVGVARDVKHSSLLDEPSPFFFVPQSQNYHAIHVLQLRTAVLPESLIPAVEAEVRDLDPNLPVYDVMTMEQSLGSANGYFLFKMGAAFAGSLGGLGLLLAVVGVYGVVSYNASLRKHEIGIRMALGAEPRGIFGLVIRQAVVLVGTGVAVGLLVALAASRALVSMLVGVTSHDPLTYAGVSALLLAAALVACYIPACRAVRVDPMEALRYE